MANGIDEFNLQLSGELDQQQSKTNINSDIAKLEKAIEHLKVQAQIDPNSAKQIAQQLSNILNQKIVVDNIQIDGKVATQAGQKVGTNIANSIKASIEANKASIESVISDLNKNALGGLVTKFNLGQKGVDPKLSQDVNRLTKELNELAEQAVRTNADSSWESLVNKMSELHNILTSTGKVRVDLSAFEEVTKVADYFKGMNIKIPVESVKEVLSALNTSGIEMLGKKGSIENLKDLNQQLVQLGITFSKGKGNLNADWEETYTQLGRMDWASETNDVDQYVRVINELLVARDKLYGSGTLQPASREDVSKVLFDWMAQVEDASKKVNVLSDEQAQLQNQLAQQSTTSSNDVVKNEQRKQQEYEETAKTLQSLQDYYKKYYEAAKTSDKALQDHLKNAREQIIKQLTIDDPAKGLNGTLGVFTDHSGITQQNLDYFSAMRVELEKLGYTLGEIKWNENAYTATAKIIPIDENAIKDATEMRNILFDVEGQEKELAQTSTATANTVVLNEHKKQNAIDETAEKVEEEIQRSERLAKAQTRLKDSYDQISKNYDVKSITFDNTIDADKDAHNYFKELIADEEALIYTTSKLGELGGLKEFTTHIKRASGELESLRFILDDDPESDNGRFRFAESVINDKGHLQQVEQIEKTYTNYLNKLNDLKTKYSEASVDYSGFEKVLNNFRQGTTDVNALKVAFNELSNSAKLGVQSLKSQDSSFDPIQQALNNMRDMPSMLKTLEASMSGVKDKTSLAGISVKELTDKYEVLQAEMTQNGGKVPLTEKWTSDYRELMSTITSATKQVDALKKAEASDNSQATKQANYYSSILASYRQMYDIKKKLLTAGEEEAKVLESQRKSLSASIASNYKQLGKQGLTDKDWQSQVDALKKEQEYQLNLTQARISDKNAIQEQTQAQRDYANALKEQEALQKNLDKIQLSTDITKIENDYKRFGIVSQEVENNLKELKIARENALKAEGTDRASAEIEKYNQKLAETKSSWKELQATQVSANQRTSQMTAMQEWMRKNQRATKLCGDQVERLIKECQTCDKVRFDQIKNEFKELQVEAGKAGKLGNTLFGGIIEQGKKFLQWTGVTGIIMAVSNKVEQAVDELIDLDDILTEITKTSDLTEQQLKKLGDTAYDTASKYGKKASDYLTGVQEMYRAGFDNAEQMAELSVLAQSAGDMESNSANDYLMATNAAYDYKGSIEELNKVLDSQNFITNNAAVSMQDMADATSEAASIASQYGVEVDELSALIAVAVSKTRESGSEVGTALKALLINLQDTTSKPITEAFDAVGISMTKMVNGSEQLKTPIELIKELSVAFNSLPEGDIKRANILNDIGGKHHANTLAAILSDLESYNSMLELYNNTSADGSAFREAEKSANNLSGSLNKLSNTWTDTVDNILNSDTLTTGVNVLNDLLGMVNKLTDALGGLGTVGLGAGLFASFKGAGRVKIAYPHLYTYACRNKTLYA